jgi:hypothetical protein
MSVNGSPDWPGVAAALLNVDGDLRFRDINLGFVLGVGVRELRKLAAKRRVRLEAHGPLPSRGGCFLLGEQQALAIIGASRCATKAAAASLINTAFAARRLQDQGLDPRGAVVREAAQALANSDFCLLPLGAAALERAAVELAEKEKKTPWTTTTAPDHGPAVGEKFCKRKEA